MSMFTRNKFGLPMALVMIVGLGLLSSQSFAFGSKEKSPEEESADNGKKAVNQYNDGVKQMENAKAIGRKGESAYAYNYRATSDAKAKKSFEKAVGNFLDALKLKPDMPEAYNNLGFCYRKLGNLDASLKAYEKAIQLKSDFTQAREYRGETYLALGDLAKAQGELDTLKIMKSPLADTLSKSIELYQLEKISEQTKAK